MKDTISYSEMSTILRCTQRWQYAYGEDLESLEPPLYLNKGKLLHRAMAHWLSGLTVMEAWDEAHLEIAEDGLALPDGTIELRTQLEAFSNAHPLTDDVELQDMELEFTVDLGLPHGVKFHGFIDAVLEHDDQLYVVEHKTATRAWSSTQFDFHYQMPLYILAAEKLYGREVQGVYNFFYPKKFEQKFVWYSPEQLDMIREQLVNAVNVRESLIPETTTRQAHWGCNDCWFRNLCLTELNGDQFNADHLREFKFKVRDRGV